MIFEAYKLKDNPNKMLRITKDDVGWYYIDKLPAGRDNIFCSIEEVELVLGIELEKPPHWSKEVQ
jgi:hypothetical protein